MTGVPAASRGESRIVAERLPRLVDPLLAHPRPDRKDEVARKCVEVGFGPAPEQVGLVRQAQLPCDADSDEPGLRQQERATLGLRGISARHPCRRAHPCGAPKRGETLSQV